jgi:H+/Cl- antiporter ClcA
VKPHHERSRSLTRAALLLPFSALLNAYPLHQLREPSLNGRSADLVLLSVLALGITGGLCCSVLFRWAHDLREGYEPWRKVLTVILLLLAAVFPLLTGLLLVLGTR